MTEPKKVAFSTLGSIKKEKKREKRIKSVRIMLTLAESNEKSCPEFNYRELVSQKLHERLGKKRLGDVINGPVLDPNDPFVTDEDAALKCLARQFENRYGGYTPNRKKKRRKENDFSTLGEGYDETDPFIDNSDAFDEVVPTHMETKHRGFYINSGELDFEMVAEESDDDEGSLDSEVDIRRRKKQTRIYSDEEEQHDEEEMDEAEGIEEYEEDCHSKKRKLYENGIIRHKKRKLDEGELLRKRKRMIGQFNAKNQEKKDSDQENEKVINGSDSKGEAQPNEQSIKASIEAVVSRAREEAADKKDDSQESASSSSNSSSSDSDSSGSSSSSESDSEDDEEEGGGGDGAENEEVNGEGEDEAHDTLNDNHHLSDNENNIPLPENLPPDLTQAINKLKEEGHTSKGSSQKFFTDSVNKVLLSIEMKLNKLGGRKKTQIYNHLSQHLPCGTQTLVKRAKNLLSERQESRLREPLRRLKEAVEAHMPPLVEQHALECQKAAESNPQQYWELYYHFWGENGINHNKEDNNEDGEKKKSKLPKKKFIFTEEIRKLLCDVVNVRVQFWQMIRKRSETPEENIRRFLESEVRSIWPKGWMNVNILYKESNESHAVITDKMFVKPVPVKRQISLGGGSVSSVSSSISTQPPKPSLSATVVPKGSPTAVSSMSKGEAIRKKSSTGEHKEADIPVKAVLTVTGAEAVAPAGAPTRESIVVAAIEAVAASTAARDSIGGAPARESVVAAAAAAAAAAREAVAAAAQERESVEGIPARESLAAAVAPAGELVAAAAVPARESVAAAAVPARESVAAAAVPARESVAAPAPAQARESVAVAAAPARELIVATVPARESVAAAPARDLVVEAAAPAVGSVAIAAAPARESVVATSPARELVATAVPARETVVALVPTQARESAPARESVAVAAVPTKEPLAALATARELVVTAALARDSVGAAAPAEVVVVVEAALARETIVVAAAPTSVAIVAAAPSIEAGAATREPLVAGAPASEAIAAGALAREAVVLAAESPTKVIVSGAQAREAVVAGAPAVREAVVAGAPAATVAAEKTVSLSGGLSIKSVDKINEGACKIVKGSENVSKIAGDCSNTTKDNSPEKTQSKAVSSVSIIDLSSDDDKSMTCKVSSSKLNPISLSNKEKNVHTSEKDATSIVSSTSVIQRVNSATEGKKEDNLEEEMNLVMNELLQITKKNSADDNFGKATLENVDHSSVTSTTSKHQNVSLSQQQRQHISQSSVPQVKQQHNTQSQHHKKIIHKPSAADHTKQSSPVQQPKHVTEKSSPTQQQKHPVDHHSPVQQQIPSPQHLSPVEKQGQSVQHNSPVQQSRQNLQQNSPVQHIKQKIQQNSAAQKQLQSHSSSQNHGSSHQPKQSPSHSLSQHHGSSHPKQSLSHSSSQHHGSSHQSKQSQSHSSQHHGSSQSKQSHSSSHQSKQSQQQLSMQQSPHQPLQQQQPLNLQQPKPQPINLQQPLNMQTSKTQQPLNLHKSNPQYPSSSQQQTAPQEPSHHKKQSQQYSHSQHHQQTQPKSINIVSSWNKGEMPPNSKNSPPSTNKTNLWGSSHEVSSSRQRQTEAPIVSSADPLANLRMMHGLSVSSITKKAPASTSVYHNPAALATSSIGTYSSSGTKKSSGSSNSAPINTTSSVSSHSASTGMATTPSKSSSLNYSTNQSKHSISSHSFSSQSSKHTPSQAKTRSDQYGASVSQSIFSSMTPEQMNTYKQLQQQHQSNNLTSHQQQDLSAGSFLTGMTGLSNSDMLKLMTQMGKPTESFSSAKQPGSGQRHGQF